MSSMKDVFGCLCIMFWTCLGEMYFVFSRIMEAPAFRSSGIRFFDDGP